MTLANIGPAYLKLGDTATARDYFGRALPLARRVGNKVWMGTPTNNLGLASLQAGDVTSRLAHFIASLQWRRAASEGRRSRDAGEPGAILRPARRR